jgi:hypothetical protein
MGRREDGAAVREGRRCASNSPGRPSGETPPSADAAPRASGKRTLKHSGDGGAPLAGIRTCRQELADRRGWSTFSKARPVLVADAARGAPEGASLLKRREGTPSQSVHRVALAGPSTGSLASSRVCRRSAPLDRERRIAIGTAAYPAPTKEHGRWRMPASHVTLRCERSEPRRVSDSEVLRGPLRGHLRTTDGEAGDGAVARGLCRLAPQDDE